MDRRMVRPPPSWRGMEERRTRDIPTPMAECTPIISRGGILEPSLPCTAQALIARPPGGKETATYPAEELHGDASDDAESPWHEQSMSATFFTGRAPPPKRAGAQEHARAQVREHCDDAIFCAIKTHTDGEPYVPFSPRVPCCSRRRRDPSPRAPMRNWPSMLSIFFLPLLASPARGACAVAWASLRRSRLVARLVLDLAPADVSRVVLRRPPPLHVPVVHRTLAFHQSLQIARSCASRGRTHAARPMPCCALIPATLPSCGTTMPSWRHSRP